MLLCARIQRCGNSSHLLQSGESVKAFPSYQSRNVFFSFYHFGHRMCGAFALRLHLRRPTLQGAGHHEGKIGGRRFHDTGGSGIPSHGFGWGSIDTWKLSQYAAGSMTIYGAVKGGEGDSERNLFMHPSEAAAYAKVVKEMTWLPSLLIILEILFAGPLIFATTITLIKVSTLLLYKRIFVTKQFFLACHVVIALTIGWYLASIFVSTL